MTLQPFVLDAKFTASNYANKPSEQTFEIYEPGIGYSGHRSLRRTLVRLTNNLAWMRGFFLRLRYIPVLEFS